MKILLSILVSLIINQFSLSFKCGHDSIFKNNKIAKFENIISFIIIIMLPLLRFISGVHWFTDIIGGILLSLSLLLFFKYFVDCKK